MIATLAIYVGAAGGDSRLLCLLGLAAPRPIPAVTRTGHGEPRALRLSAMTGRSMSCASRRPGSGKDAANISCCAG